MRIIPTVTLASEPRVPHQAWEIDLSLEIKEQLESTNPTFKASI